MYVVLQHELVDDAAAGLPESDAVLLSCRREEIEDLLFAS